MSVSAMKCALQSLESVEKVKGWNKDSVVGRHCTQSAHFLRQAIEFEEMVKKGTKAWDGTPDDWVDELRGGTEKQEPDVDIYDVWVEQKPKEKNVPQP